jgi:hypothetical protein
MGPMLGRLIWMVGALMLLPRLGTSAETAPPVGVVELFTSQGCSDCPPADALLGELAQSPGVIALAYHVTYWDQLGWHDRFELPQADARQEYYARQLRLSTLFTPQAVIDGHVSFIGADRLHILRALRASRVTTPVALGLKNGQVLVELAAQELPAPANVILVGYLPQAVTAVGRGENGGRKLEEFNIVRAYDVLGVWRGNATQFLVPLSSLPSETSRIAVLLQMPTGAMAGAATLAVR